MMRIRCLGGGTCRSRKTLPCRQTSHSNRCLDDDSRRHVPCGLVLGPAISWRSGERRGAFGGGLPPSESMTEAHPGPGSAWDIRATSLPMPRVPPKNTGGRTGPRQTWRWGRWTIQPGDPKARGLVHCRRCTCAHPHDETGVASIPARSDTVAVPADFSVAGCPEGAEWGA